MNNFILIYNIILTIVLTIGLTGFYTIYKKYKKKEFFFLALLFFIFIIDNSTVFLAEFSKDFYKLYESSTFFVIFLDLSYLSMVLVVRFIIVGVFNDPFTKLERIASLLIPIGLTALNLWASEAVSELAIYSIFYTSFIYLLIRTHYHLKLKTDNYNENKIKYKIITGLMILLCFAGIIENALYTFLPDNNTFLNIAAFEYRYLSFDILKLFVSLLGIRYLFNSFENLFNNKSSREKMDLFCEHYGLTLRQKEIIELVIEGYSNKEIGDQLNITEGTVKTHVYNIFKKAEVSNRNQITSKIMHH